MASPSPDLDIEAQTNNSTVTWPEINLESPHSANPQLSTSPEPPVQHTSTSQHHYENAARKITDNSRVERGILTSFFGFTSRDLILVPDEKYGDSSDEFWLMYLTEAEKQDKEVTESWKGDTDGILVFVSLTLHLLCIFSLIFKSHVKDWSVLRHRRCLHHRKLSEPIS